MPMAIHKPRITAGDEAEVDMAFPIDTVIDPELCIGCGEYLRVCPTDAFSMEDDIAVVSGEEAIDCGHCAAVCPADAITVEFIDHDALDLVTVKESSAHVGLGDFDTAYLVQLMRSRRSCRNYQKWRQTVLYVFASWHMKASAKTLSMPSRSLRNAASEALLREPRARARTIGDTVQPKYTGGTEELSSVPYIWPARPVDADNCTLCDQGKLLPCRSVEGSHQLEPERDENQVTDIIRGSRTPPADPIIQSTRRALDQLPLKASRKSLLGMPA